MRTTYVPPFTAETAKELQRKTSAPVAGDTSAPSQRGNPLLIGLDLGTNTSRLFAAWPGSPDLVADEVLPTLVGYAREGIVENLLPGNAKTLYGQLAAKNRLYLRMVAPLANGVIADMAAAQDFIRYLRQTINAPVGTELHAVVGLPARADRAAHDGLAHALTGFFDRVMLVPEPFLAALGFRDEARLSDPAYLDPVSNSIFVDIGAGTTDVCLVQGYFPTGDDQVSAAFAGDKVDEVLHAAIRHEHPDVELSRVKVRELKEQHSYVGRLETPIVVSVLVGGKPRKLDLSAVVGDACQQLLVRVFDCVTSVIAQASSDSVAAALQNIILTGGGSRTRNLDTELQRLLVEDGYEAPRVLTVGERYKDHVARGALAAARQAKESQWLPLPV
jgi:rod shape-determining protein MreB